MKWASHIAIAGSSALLVSPELAVAAAIGSTAPDWLEWLIKPFKNIQHRRETHYLVVWFVLLLLSYMLSPFGFVTAFFYGGLTHILADALTIAGVPFSPASRSRFHLFGGRLRTGSASEYVIAFSFSAICLFLAFKFQPSVSVSSFSPYFIDYKKAYNSGLISEYEYRKNRFKFF